MEKVIVIGGQTAVGKTKLSLELAKLINGEIINGDAMQVYKEFNILTDKIKDNEKGNIPHHLFDIKSVNEDYNVNEYQANIRKVIHDINEKGKIPILIGGTGLYIKAALYDYYFANEEIDRKEIEDKYIELDNASLYEKLTKLDYEASLNIHPNNRRRVLAALAMAESGESKSSRINKQNHELIYDAIIITLTMDKELAIKKMDQRIDKMFSEGVIEEVRNNKTTSTASKAIGYAEISDYLANKISLEEAKNLMKIHTHQYAKRQRTWFKHQMNSLFINSDEKALDNIYEVIKEKWKVN